MKKEIQYKQGTPATAVWNGKDYEVERVSDRTASAGSVSEEYKPWMTNYQKVECLLKTLTDDERKELFGDYCIHCGCDSPCCQCWNDE
mgnify:CR=1 FL=1